MEIKQGGEKVGEIDVEKREDGSMIVKAITLPRLRRPMFACEIATGRTVDGIPSVEIGVLGLRKLKANLISLVYKHSAIPGLDYESIVRFLLAAACHTHPEFFQGVDDIKVKLIDVRNNLILFQDLHCHEMEEKDAFKLVPWQKVLARLDVVKDATYEVVYGTVLDVVTGWPENE
jgi:hypothetical protein